MAYTIKIKTATGCETRTAIGDIGKTVNAIYDEFGACGITVIPL